MKRNWYTECETEGGRENAMIPPLSNTYSDIRESECEVKQNEKTEWKRQEEGSTMMGRTIFNLESRSTRTHARGEAEGLWKENREGEI